MATLTLILRLSSWLPLVLLVPVLGPLCGASLSGVSSGGCFKPTSSELEEAVVFVVSTKIGRVYAWFMRIAFYLRKIYMYKFFVNILSFMSN